MQLDKTEIVIRERATLELFDLTLMLIRRYFGRLLVSSAILGLPFMLINVAITAWMVNEQTLALIDDFDDAYLAARMRHTLHIVALWFLQYPLASLPATLFIGNKIFFEDLSLRAILRQMRPLVWRSVWVLGIARLGLVGLLCEFLVDRGTAFEPFIELFVLTFCMCGVAGLVRAAKPFAPEILGLESCKLRADSTKELSYSRRSRGLHGPFFSENFGRFVTCSIAVVGLVVSIGSIPIWLLSLIDWLTAWQGWADHLVLPLTLWLVSIFVTVFRFLSYLDARIRLEGWEVELQLKAERQRLLPRSDLGTVAVDAISAIPNRTFDDIIASTTPGSNEPNVSTSPIAASPGAPLS